MRMTPLSLAALATSAVPDVRFGGIVDDGTDHLAHRAAATTETGALVQIVVPRSGEALGREQAQADALAAATEGVRERLPFLLPTLLGRAPAGRSEVFVWTRLGGDRASLATLSEPGFAESVGQAIAALHSLPTSIVADAGLPQRQAASVRDDVMDVFDRAAATRRVPSALLERWERTATHTELWQFPPTVVHGDLQSSSFFAHEGRVVAVAGWRSLSVGDPAADLSWMLGSADFDAVDRAFAAYQSARDADRFLRSRAMLHAELGIARWLLFGVEQGDEPTIQDAEAMLAALVDRVEDTPAEHVQIEPQRYETMDLSAVQAMLDKTGSLTAARGGGRGAAESTPASEAPTEVVERDAAPANDPASPEDRDA